MCGLHSYSSSRGWKAGTAHYLLLFQMSFCEFDCRIKQEKKQLSKVALIFLQDLCNYLTQNSAKVETQWCTSCYIPAKMGLVYYSATGVCLRIPPVGEIFPDL